MSRIRTIYTHSAKREIVFFLCWYHWAMLELINIWKPAHILPISDHGYLVWCVNCFAIKAILFLLLVEAVRRKFCHQFHSEHHERVSSLHVVTWLRSFKYEKGSVPFIRQTKWIRPSVIRSPRCYTVSLQLHSSSVPKNIGTGVYLFCLAYYLNYILIIEAHTSLRMTWLRRKCVLFNKSIFKKSCSRF